MKQQKNDCLIWLVIFCCYFLRLFFLDADVLAFSLAEIQPIDELYYNEVAIKIAKYGFDCLKSGELSGVSVVNAKTFIIPNIITACSLKLFGINYWGLKIPFVLMGFFVAIFMFLIIRLIFPEYKKIQFLVTFMYIVDFNVLMLSREAVTVIPCMLATIITVYAMLSIKKSDIRYFFAGGWAVISFCTVYMGVPFIMLAVTVILLYDSIYETIDRKRTIAAFFVGIFVGIIISEMISISFFGQHIVKTITDTLLAHGEKVTLGFTARIQDIISNNVLKYWVSNAFRYNYMIFVLAILSLVRLLYEIIQYRNKVAIILFTFICTHWGQTIFLDNMTASKATITFPVVLIAISYTLVITIKNAQHRTLKREKVIDIIILVSTILIAIYAIPLVEEVFCFAILLSIFITSICIVLFIKKKNIRVLWIPYIYTCILMSSLSYQYVFDDLSYNDKNIMIDIGRETSNGIVINGTSFSLYNMCESPVDVYDHYGGSDYDYKRMWDSMVDASYRYEDIYFIGDIADNEWNVSRINKLLENSPWEFIEVKRYSRKYRMTIGDHNTSDIILYKKEEK